MIQVLKKLLNTLNTFSDELLSLSESDFDSSWEIIQRQIKDSQSSIDAFRDDCIALESSLIQSTGDILESTLSG